MFSDWIYITLMLSRSQRMRRGDANVHLRLIHWYTSLTRNLHHLKQKKEAVLSMGLVSRPTLYKYLNTKGHVYCIVLTEVSMEIWCIRITTDFLFKLYATQTPASLFVLDARYFKKLCSPTALFCKLPIPFELGHMHIICKLKHAISIKIGVICCYHL